MEYQKNGLSQFHQSKLVKILSIILIICINWLSFEPAFASLTEETPPYDLAVRLQEIRNDVDSQYAAQPEGGLLQDILRRTSANRADRNRLLPGRGFASGNTSSSGANSISRLPVLPSAQLSPAAIQPGIWTDPEAFATGENVTLRPNPLNQLPPFIRKNIQDEMSSAQPPQAKHVQDVKTENAKQETAASEEPQIVAEQSTQIETSVQQSYLLPNSSSALPEQEPVLLAENYSDAAPGYMMLAQSYCTNQYAVGSGSSRQSLFVDAYNRKGGGELLGCTINSAHWWNNVVIQDFRYSPSVADAAIIHDENRDNPAFSVPAVALMGGIWNMYRGMGGPNSWLGVPTGEENHYDPAVSSRVRAYFQYGYIQWDTAVSPYSERGKVYAWPVADPNLWRAEYHNGFNLNAGATFIRNESAIDYDWGTEFPGGNCHNDPCWGVWKDNFSVRWTKQVNFQAGRYNFIARSDDGVRVWIDGNLIIDGWYDHGTLEFRRAVDVSGGNHTLKVEYYEKTSGANIKFWWEPVTSPDGSLAHWKFDQNTLDSSGSNYHGTQSGGIAYVEGEIDDGVLLDGSDDYIVVTGSANGLSFGGTAPFTIDGWINPRMGGSGGTIISKFNGNVRGEYILKVLSDGRVNFHREVSPFDLITTGTIPFGEFTHVAVTYDGAVMRTYINGKPDVEQSRGAQATDTITPVLIGARYQTGTLTEFFNGVIDDLRFYNRALSREEILYYATETKPGPLSDKDRERFRKLGVQPCMPGTGDPVNSATGSSIQQFADLVVSGRGDLDFAIERTFNGLDDRDGLFGKGWSSFLDVTLRIANDDSIDLRYPDGRSVYFTRTGDTYTPGQGGVFDVLTRTDSGFKVLRTDQSAYLFDFKGRLASLVDRYGLTMTLMRDANHQISRIIDTVGREFGIASDGVHITAITDPVGRLISYTYDANGNLIKVTDANGGERLFQYANQRLVQVTDPEGMVYMQNTYDAEGRVIEQVDANGQHSYFDYNTPNQTVFTDNLGQTTTYIYDSLSRVIEIRDALGQSEHNVYDANDNLTAYTDKRDHTWTYTYDARGNMLSETDPMGAATRFTYNATNDMLTMTAPNGGVTAYEWQAGKLVKITPPDNSTIVSTYNTFGQILTMTDALGGVTQYAYNPHGALERVTDPLGNVTLYEYDAVGRQVQMTDANGHTVQFAYDGKDNVTQITYPDTTTVTFTYSGNDDVLSMTDRRGGVTTYQYDANLKLVAETDPTGATTRYEYNALGHMSKEIDPRGNATLYRYDTLGQLLEVEDALGKITQFMSDANGNIVIATDALGQQTHYVYDEMNRLSRETDALGGVTAFTYDALGQPVTITAPNGAVSQYVYNVLGQLTTVTDPLGHNSQMAYDAAGNLTSVTDANGHTATLTYDAVGNLIRSVNALGKVSQFTYDGVGNQLTSKDELGRTTTYQYDPNDNLFLLIDPVGFTTMFQYDSADNLIALTDGNGAITQFEYNAAGLLATLTDALGNITSNTYDAAQNLLTETYPNGGVWTYSYDALNRLTTQADPLGSVTTYSYDQLDRLAQITDALGRIIRYEYDALDRQIKEIDPKGGVWLSAYDAVDNLLTSTDPRGAITRYTYDLVDQLIAIRDALDGIHSLSYDPAGNLTALADANGHVVTMTYDVEDNLREELDALGNLTRYGYDDVGNLTAVTDALGRITRYQYDNTDNLTRITNAAGHQMGLTYDAEGNLLALTDPNGHATQFEYDANGMLVTETLPGGQQTSYVYDAMGNLAQEVNAKGHAWTYTYDVLDRLISEADPLGNATHYQYDALDNLLRLTDAHGSQTRFTYDVSDRLTEVQDVLNGRTRYAYDTTDNLTEITNALGNPTRFQYDALARLTQETDALGKVWTYQYDAVGNRVRQTANGQITQYAYNANDQLTALNHPDGTTVTFAYDTVGNEVGMTDRLGTTRNDYDALDRLVATTNPGGFRVGYEYDAADNLTKLTYPDSRALSYGYDANDQVKEIVDAALNRFLITRDAAQNITQISNPNGTAVNYTWDAAERLTGVRHTQGSNVISAFAYTRDPVGNIVQAAEESSWRTPRQLTHTYTYDALARLTRSQDSAGNFTAYVFDAVGNRLSQTTNIAERPQARTKTEYGYGAENRLTSVKNFIDPGNGTWQVQNETEIQYDGYGRAARRIVTANGQQSRIDYIFNGLDPIAEYVDGGAEHANYYRGTGRLLSLLETDGQAQSQAFYYHPDGLGSVSALTNAQGQLAQGYRYLDYGDILNRADELATSSDFLTPRNPYTYTGQEVDATNGLFHFFARGYDPEVGVWLQQDVYRGQPNDPPSLHRYGYVTNNPHSYFDTYGFKKNWLQKKIDQGKGWAKDKKDDIKKWANDKKDDVKKWANEKKEQIKNMTVKQVINTGINKIKNSRAGKYINKQYSKFKNTKAGRYINKQYNKAKNSKAGKYLNKQYNKAKNSKFGKYIRKKANEIGNTKVKDIPQSLKQGAKKIVDATKNAAIKGAKKIADTIVAAKNETVKLAKEEGIPRCKLLYSKYKEELWDNIIQTAVEDVIEAIMEKGGDYLFKNIFVKSFRYLDKFALSDIGYGLKRTSEYLPVISLIYDDYAEYKDAKSKGLDSLEIAQRIAVRTTLSALPSAVGGKIWGKVAKGAGFGADVWYEENKEEIYYNLNHNPVSNWMGDQLYDLWHTKSAGGDLNVVEIECRDNPVYATEHPERCK